MRVILAHVGVAAVALPPALLVLKLGVHIVGKSAPNAERQSLTHDIGGKVHWFLHQPLYRSLSLFDLTPSRVLATVVAIVTVGGIPLLLRHQGVRRPLLYVGVAVVLIPLSFLPSLVVTENSASFRVEVALSSLIALYACLGALGIWLTFRDWLRPLVSDHVLVTSERLAVGASVAFVAASAFIGAKNVSALFVEPQITELRMIRSQIAAFPPGATRIGFVQVNVYGGMSRLVISDEFGLPSSAQPWTPEASVLLILHEDGRLAPHQPRPIVETLSSDIESLPKNEPVVDVRGLARLR